MVERSLTTTEEICELNEQVRPVIVPTLTTARYLDNADPFSQEFFYDRRPLGYANPLQLVAIIPTLHKSTSEGCFAPPLAEVLVQIPKQYLDPNLGAVRCYDIQPDTENGITRTVRVKGEQFYRGSVRLYRYSPSA